MRREQIEEQILELVAVVDDKIARVTEIVWARSLPDSYAISLAFPSGPWIVISEAHWDESPDDRADTVAHEVAHIAVPDYSHGSRWRSRYRRLRRIAHEMDWS